MSIETNIFVGPGCTLEQVAECVESVIERRLERSTNRLDEAIYVGSVMSIQVTAYPADNFEDDAGIEFSRYAFAVNFEPYASPYDLRAELGRVLALIIASTVCDVVKCECIATEGLNRILRSFTPAIAS